MHRKLECVTQIGPRNWGRKNGTSVIGLMVEAERSKVNL